MKSVTLVILLTICGTSYGLRCATTEDGQPLEELLSDLGPVDLLEMIHGFSTTDEYNYTMCRIEFYVSYNQNSLIVNFTKHLAYSTLRDERIQIDTFFDGTNVTDIGFSHSIKYSCSQDLCELEFIQNYSRIFLWLLDDDYAIFSDFIALSIFGDNDGQGE